MGTNNAFGRSEGLLRLLPILRLQSTPFRLVSCEDDPDFELGLHSRLTQTFSSTTIKEGEDGVFTLISLRPHIRLKMKFFTSLVLSTMLVTAAFAQRAFIGTPTEGSSVKAGSNITVEVDRPDTLTGSTEVAIVIGILSCSRFSPQTCPPPTDIIGSVMYKGQYNPEFHTNVSASKPPHQNFTLTIPASMQKGPAQISLTHLSLVGAGPFPFFETQNVTVNVV